MQKTCQFLNGWSERINQLRAVVTHLEMLPPYRLSPSFDMEPGYSFSHIENVAIADYRQIYNEIGMDWHWVNRRHMSDGDLSAIIHKPTTEVFFLKQNNRIIGFTEFNLAPFPDVEIVFVGLVSEFIGHGLGKAILSAGLDYLYSKNPQRIYIQTCSLDHPNAISMYQRFGFKAFSRQNVLLENEQFTLIV